MEGLENARRLRRELLGQGLPCDEPVEVDGEYVFRATYTSVMDHAQLEKFLSGLPGVELMTEPA